MIQNEYGWSDDEVLDLTLGRFRQVVAVILFRKRDERRREETLVEWQTKTLARFIAATVPTEKGKKNPLLDEVDKIQLNTKDKQGKSPTDVPPEVYVEQGSQVGVARNGSFERLMSGFGG